MRNRLPVKPYPIAAEVAVLGEKVRQYLHPAEFGITDISDEGRRFLAAVEAGFVTPDAEGLGTLLAYQGEGRLNEGQYSDWYQRASSGEQPYENFDAFLRGLYSYADDTPTVAADLLERVARLERLVAGG